MQPIHEPLRAILLEAIRVTPPDVTWIIRMHPVMSAETIDRLANRVLAIRTENIEIQNDAQQPLPAALATVDLHITEYSSVVIEAAELGVPSLVLAEEAETLYEHYVRAGVARFAATAVDICAAIERQRPLDIIAPRPRIDDALHHIVSRLSAS